MPTTSKIGEASALTGTPAMRAPKPAALLAVTTPRAREELGERTAAQERDAVAKGVPRRHGGYSAL